MWYQFYWLKKHSILSHKQCLRFVCTSPNIALMIPLYCASHRIQWSTTSGFSAWLRTSPRVTRTSRRLWTSSTRDIRRCMQSLQFWVCSGAMPRDNVKSCSEDHAQSSNSDLNMKERSAIEVDIQGPKQNGHINSNGTPETASDPTVNGTCRKQWCVWW